jgi:hypothetical protein
VTRGLYATIHHPHISHDRDVGERVRVSSMHPCPSLWRRGESIHLETGAVRIAHSSYQILSAPLRHKQVEHSPYNATTPGNFVITPCTGILVIIVWSNIACWMSRVASRVGFMIGNNGVVLNALVADVSEK